jgi:hypothetical protein
MMNVLVKPFFQGPIIQGLKIHTLRQNYDFWKKRIDKCEKLELRYWSGKPYCSPQKHIRTLNRYNANFGVQKICKKTDGIYPGSPFSLYLVKNEEYLVQLLLGVVAKNDGLTEAEFVTWFEDYPDGDMACIQFTGFRYGEGDL